MPDKFKRWKIPFIGSGATGKNGGNWKILGLKYTRNDQRYYGYSINKSLSFFGLFCIRHCNDMKGKLRRSSKAGFSVSFATLNFKASVKKADPHI